MNVLVDTSVWSLALRRTEPKDQRVGRLSIIINSGQTVFITGVILTELLSGIRHKQQFDRVLSFMTAFAILELSQEECIEAARLVTQCRSKGIHVSTADALIAQTAISNDCYLFSADKDFVHIAVHSNLKLLDDV